MTLSGNGGVDKAIPAPGAELSRELGAWIEPGESD